jgi:hypothetical protein
MSGSPLKDATGQRFGDRVAVSYLGGKRWLTRCACGREFTVAGADMRRSVYQCNHVPENRFWEKVDRGAGCWIWTACLQSDGYGSFRLAGKTRLAHVVAWEWSKGLVPDGLELDHLCRNRACVNPDHLEPVTHIENVRRGALGTVTKARFARKRAA